MRCARRSCGPVDRQVDVTRFECWWPAARGNPASAGRVSRELTKRPAPQTPRERRLRVVPEGRKCPAVTRRTCSVAPRHAGGVPPFVHAGSTVGRRFTVASGTNGQEGAGPSDGVRLPTKSKPSKGVALVGTQTSSEPSSDGDDGLYRNPANPRSGTGMQQARNSRCGANRRSGEIPQGRNMNRGRHTAVRTRACSGGVDARGHTGGGAPDNPRGGRSS